MSTIVARGVAKTLRVLYGILPQHTQRLVLWSTLYSKMCGGKPLTKDDGDRLIKLLALCKDRDALNLPTQLGKFIWSDLEECCTATRKALRGEHPVEVAAAEFVRAIPTWLRYASDAFMLQDFQSVLRAHRRATT